MALFFNQFINPIALDEIQWRYYIFYCCFLAFEVWYIWLYVIETRYTPLEEVSRYFDGDDKDVAGMTKAHMKEVQAEEGDGEKEEGARVEARTT